MYKISITIALVLFFGVKNFAQTENTNSVNTLFENYVSNNFQEKIFVHTDKNFYLSGETIWFKVYNNDAFANSLSPISKIAYVELIDANNKPLLQVKINIEEGMGNGQLQLPLSLPSGNYLFRTYTNWMKNFSEELAFKKIISVVNVFEKPEVDTAKKSIEYDVQFFPEGGNLVNNIQSKIAFKAVNNFGKGINFQGKIINQTNEVVVAFSPQQLGIGSFVFTPNNSNTYQAIIVTENNDTLHYNLPTIYEFGYVMNVQEKENLIKVLVEASKNFSNENVSLITHNNQKIQINQTQVLQNGTTVFTIDKSLLKEGVNVFTIFDKNNKPVCERLFYKQPEVKYMLNTTVNNTQFSTRENVNITVAANDVNKQNIASNLSVAVFKTDSLQPSESLDIQQYYWLTSELKGNIENPSFYFNNTNDHTKTALDNLLLTQGWRRFNWSNILQNQSNEKKYLPEYESQIITGKVVNKTTLLPVEGIGVYLSISGKEFGFAAAQSTSTGEFFALMPSILNSTQLIAQTNNVTDSNFRIDINSAYWDKYSSTKIPAFAITESKENELNNYGISVQSEHIYSEKPMYKSVKNYAPFFGKPDEEYFLDNYTRFSTMEEVLREYVTGIAVRKKSGKFIFHTVDAPRFQFFNTHPLVLLDGIPVFDADNIIALDPLKIKKIDVVTRTFYYGSYAFDGIASFSSYTGKLGATNLHAESLLIDYDVLQQERIFYAPKYDTKETKASRIPDYRTLLYWSGNVQTNSNSSTNINFYTSDVKGNFVAFIQGLTNTGEPVKSAVSFSVQ